MPCGRKERSLRRRMFGRGFAGMDAWIERGPSQKNQAGRERHKAAGQVGADPGRAPGHDHNVSRAQLQTLTNPRIPKGPSTLLK